MASRVLARRTYATAASAVKAPIQLNSLTGTYATSAYLAALKQSPKELDNLAKEIESLEKKIKADPKIKSLVENPTLSAKERADAVKTLAGSSSTLLQNLLAVLSENGRLSQAPKVFADFNSLIAAHRGELEVIITSAEALDQKTLTRLERAVKGAEAAEGKTLKVVNRVNPSILGGLIVDFGDKTIDLSAANKVNRFNSALAEGI